MLRMTTKAWIQSTKMTAYHLSNLKSVQSRIYWNVQAYAKSNASSTRKAGRKAVWWENVITDMVGIICSSNYMYLRTNLIFRNTSRARNTAIYTDVAKQLKERLGSRGENFPFDVTQPRNKLMHIYDAKFQEHCFNISRDIVYSVFSIF